LLRKQGRGEGKTTEHQEKCASRVGRCTATNGLKCFHGWDPQVGRNATEIRLAQKPQSTFWQPGAYSLQLAPG